MARAVRHTPTPLVLRYCNTCWPAVQLELEERQREEHKEWQKAERAWLEAQARNPEDATASPPLLPGWSCASRSWSEARSFLALLAQLPRGGSAPTPADFAAIAAEIRDGASGMDGPIPPDIEDFLARHTAPSA